MFDAACFRNRCRFAKVLCCHQCASSLLRVVVFVHVTCIYMYVLCMYLQTKAGVSINIAGGLGSLRNLKRI
jgi:hypothetical protein